MYTVQVKVLPLISLLASPISYTERHVFERAPWLCSQHNVGVLIVTVTCTSPPSYECTTQVRSRESSKRHSAPHCSKILRGKPSLHHRPHRARLFTAATPKQTTPMKRYVPTMSSGYTLSAILGEWTPQSRHQDHTSKPIDLESKRHQYVVIPRTLVINILHEYANRMETNIDRATRSLV